MDAFAVEYIAVHDPPPCRGTPRSKAALVGRRWRDKSRAQGYPLRLQPQLYRFSPGGACSRKDSVSVAGVAPLSSDATQSPAHSLVPLTVPTSLQPIGSFGFTRTSGFLPTFGGLSLAKAFAEKQIATRMTRALIVISPSPSLGGKSRMTQAYR